MSLFVVFTGKSTWKEVKEETDYHEKSDKSVIVQFCNSIDDLAWFYWKFQSFPTRKDFFITEHLNLIIKALKGFIPRVFNRLCVTHSKSSNKGTLETKSELTIFF